MQETLSTSTKNVEEVRDSFASHDGDDDEAWYVQVINKTSNTSSREDALMNLVLEEMSQFYDVVNDREFRQIELKYPSSRTVLYKVAEKIAVFDSMRDNVHAELKRLETSPAESFLNGAVDCHLRQSSLANKHKTKCELCRVSDDINAFELELFHFVRKDIKTLTQNVRKTISAEEDEKLKKAGVYLHNEQRKGNWADSEVERLLRAILRYTKLKASDFPSAVVDDGNQHMKLIDAMKKEFKLMRILWRQIYDHVAAVDELSMATLRLRARQPEEPILPNDTIKRVSDRNEEDAEGKFNKNWPFFVVTAKSANFSNFKTFQKENRFFSAFF